MKVIIAGSRSIGLVKNTWDYEYLCKLIDQAITESGFTITEVISGNANGPDKAGEIWAVTNSIPCTIIKPDWSIGRHAGMLRNSKMVDRADAAIVLYDGVSKGTKDTINKITKAGKKLKVVNMN